MFVKASYSMAVVGRGAVTRLKGVMARNGCDTDVASSSNLTRGVDKTPRNKRHLRHHDIQTLTQYAHIMHAIVTAILQLVHSYRQMVKK